MVMTSKSAFSQVFKNDVTIFRHVRKYVKERILMRYLSIED